MLLPKIKEREYRFKLALRMGLPILGLVLALVSHTLINSYQSLSASFYIESLIVVVFSIYFIFFLIYNGFETKITEGITNAFTREYLYKYLNKEIDANKHYTLILISCDNIDDINKRYGIANGDKVLRELSFWLSEYLESKEITTYPFGHIKSGDFVVGLKGLKEDYSTIMELMCLKSEELKVDGIEVKISGAINDTSYSKNLEYLIENLFELQEQNRNNRTLSSKYKEISPSKLESFVIKAVTNKTFQMKKQYVFENDKKVIKEYFVKLKTPYGKTLHPKAYMKVLDKLGLMVDFDLMVLRHAILNCANNNEIFALNISPTSIRNYKFIQELKELLLSNINSKDKVMFILNEREYYFKIDRYRATLDNLRSLGVLITIDKIGSSQTSFLYFRELNIDAIRFDTHYTKKLNDRDINILEGFIKMAQQRDLKTWVKMVESQKIKEKLSMLGIRYMQGKYLSELEDIMKDSK